MSQSEEEFREIERERDDRLAEEAADQSGLDASDDEEEDHEDRQRPLG